MVYIGIGQRVLVMDNAVIIFCFFVSVFCFFFCDIVSVAGKARAGAGLTRDFFFGLVRKAHAGGG